MKNLSYLFSDYKNTPVVYRGPVKFILRLSEFYLFVNEMRLDKLKSFEHFICKEASSFLFAVAVGSDGLPGIGMSVLISSINVGERIASSAEKFLLFGADVDENSDIVTIFFEKLVCVHSSSLKVSSSFQVYTLEPNPFPYVANFGITHKKYRTQNILKGSPK